MDELPFHKVFIDSRAASVGTASSFEITLPETLTLPRESVCYTTDIAVAYSFYSVDGVGSVGGANHFAYFLEQSAAGEQAVLCRAQLAERSYTAEELGVELATQMSAASESGTTYTANYLSGLNAISVTASTGGFVFVNEELLRDPVFQSEYSFTSLNWIASPQDCSSLLGLASGGTRNINFATLQTMLQAGLPLEDTTGHVDVRRRHCLYLHSQALANLRALGPKGSRTVLARIPVDGLYGGVLARQHSGHVLDFVPCGGRTLRTLDFSLRDFEGRLVDLRGGHISFELLFAPKPLV